MSCDRRGSFFLFFSGVFFFSFFLFGWGTGRGDGGGLVYNVRD